MKLTANQISCERLSRVLFENLNMALASGEIIQVIGENGCGKSSLLRILSGLLKPTSGTVFWNDQCIEKNASEFRENLFYLNHNLSVKADLTVRENIMYQLKNIKNSLSAIKEILEIWNLTQFENHTCRHLSQGQKQRVALAMLNLSNTKLWILDEPFSSLDILGAKQLEHCFEKHTQQNGSIIFATHRLIENETLKIETLKL